MLLSYIIIRMNYLDKKILRKVPEITLIFWVTKLLTTAMGESFSDFLVNKISPYIAVMLGAIALFIGLFLQFKSTKYRPWIYWLAVAMVAVFGTMAADVVHKQFGIPYLASTLFFTIILIIVFGAWQKSEKTLSIHSINTPKREMFYWITVLSTFALGTAAGDMTAHTFKWGHLLSGIIFSLLIILIAILYKYFNMNEVLAFWLSYIITRPAGASFADWLGKPSYLGGKGWGDGFVAFLLTILIIICVIYMTRNKVELNKETTKH